MSKSNPTKRATIHDVAERAGVSYQTVSRVLNDHPRVADKTRERVNQAIKDLQYYPNSAARDLAAHQSRLIGVISSNLEHYGPTQMLTNIEQSAREAGYDLIFATVNPHDAASTQAAADLVRRWSVAGVVVVAPVQSAAYDNLLMHLSNIPNVQIDIRKSPNSGISSVIIDQQQGSLLLTQHLVSLGHRRIAKIGGPDDWFGAEARLDGYLAALSEAQLEPIVLGPGDWTAESAYDVIQSLNGQIDFTALVVANDQMALGAMYALQELGLHVPGDVSVTGFDDIPEAKFFSPALTTVRQDFSQLGQQGLAYLQDLIDNNIESVVRQIVIEPQIILRDSTSPPRLSD